MAAILRGLDRTAKGRARVAMAAPGRPQRRLPGGYIHDLAALGKAILLLPHEAKKFNAEAVGYATPKDNSDFCQVTGYSDASGERCNRNGILFLKKE